MFTRRQEIMNSFSLDVGHCLATFVILGALQLAILSSAMAPPLPFGSSPGSDLFRHHHGTF